MPVTRVQALWNGFLGAPGYSNFHFDGELTATQINQAAGGVRKLFADLAALLPTAATIAIRPTVDIYDIQGTKIGEKPVGTVPGVAQGTSTAAYAGGTGAVINWRTGAYRNGRPVNGRTFLVPMSAGYAVDGSLLGQTVTTILTAATAYRGTAGVICGVWQHNPQKTFGGFSPISGVTVPDRPAVLRSRR